MTSEPTAAQREKAEEVKVYHVAVWICELCLTAKGGECHVPGCVFCFRDAPAAHDAPLLGDPMVENADDLLAEARAEGARAEREALVEIVEDYLNILKLHVDYFTRSQIVAAIRARKGP
jgi:hypothetical protein